MVAFTVEEACEILDPAISPGQLRQIIAALRIPPSGSRYTGRAGRPPPTWDAAEIMRLHAALMPWLVTPGRLPGVMGARLHALITGRRPFRMPWEATMRRRNRPEVRQCRTDPCAGGELPC